MEGLSSTQSLMLDVHPQPPLLVKPENSKTMRGKGPLLRWTASSEARSYYLQISLYEDFSKILLEQKNIKDNYFDMSKLKEIQTYYWRVASISSDEEVGPFSLSRNFVIKAIPELVNTQLKASDDNITLSWQDSDRGQSYNYQLAEDIEFNKIISQDDLKNPQLIIPQSDMGVRYFRVRSIETDGYIGNWSASQKIDPIEDNRWLYFYLPAILFIL